MRALLAVPLLLVTGTFTACATPCDRAIEVIETECRTDVAPREVGDTCEGERRAFSQCIVDHPHEACDYFYDPLAAADNAFARCIAAIP